jgi:chemotaxis signal transduction protein
VIALVFARLCEVKAHMSKPAIRPLSVRSDRTQTGAKEEIATFLVGRRWFAARTKEIVEAIDVGAILPLPFMPPGMAGCVMYRDAPLPVLDLLRVLEPPVKGADSQDARAAAQIVVMAPSNGMRFGLMVDDLGEIAEVLTERLMPLPPMAADQDVFADQALAPNGDEEGGLIVMLRADRLHESLSTLIARAPDRNAPSSRTGKVVGTKRVAAA